MAAKQYPRKLNRFTDWRELLVLARTKTIVLRETSTWKDKNDVEVIKMYEKRKAKRVLAKCFCQGRETIHHWQAFANGPSGCCVQFDGRELLAAVDTIGAVHGPVEYQRIDAVTRQRPPLDHFPFVKRLPYDIEKEYRILWLGTKEEKTKEIPIRLNSITRSLLAPRFLMMSLCAKESCCAKSLAELPTS